MDLPTGEVVADRYRVVDRLGRGGMAVVYRAHDEVLDRRVALKVLSGHLLADDRSVGRFGREARAAAGLNHPNVVAVHDAASDGDVHFLVMELVDGESLSDHLRTDAPLSVDESLSIADRVAAALGAAHERGLVHRDVKPSNILLTAGGDVKVADFGIARAVAAEATQTAVVMGSVPYVAPEQLDGTSGADPRSDLYALGCVLFECLTGGPPFAADTSAAVLGQHLHAPAPSVHDHRPDAGDPIDALVASLLAKDPDQRPASAEDLRARIARVRAGEDPGGGGVGGVGPGAGGAAAGAAAAGGAAAGAAGLWASRDAPAGQDAADPTEVVDPRFSPTEAVDPAGSTRRLSAAESDDTSRLDDPPPPATASSSGAGGGGMDQPPSSGSGRSRGRAWLVGLLVVLLLAVIAWALIDRGDSPAVDPTAPPDATEEPADATEPPEKDATTPADATTAPEPSPTAPAEPTADPTTEPEPDPTTPAEPSPTAPPTTAPTTTAPPTTPAPTTPAPTVTTSPTEQALVDLRQDLVDGVDTGQLDRKAADKIGEGIAKVAEVLASGDADRVAKAQEEIGKVREELDKQVEAGTNPGIARQLARGLDDLEATLA